VDTGIARARELRATGRLIAKEGEDEICDQLREETIPAIWSGKVRKPIVTLRKAATGVRKKADAQC
jgi:hypothetical protein